MTLQSPRMYIVRVKITMGPAGAVVILFIYLLWCSDILERARRSAKESLGVEQRLLQVLKCYYAVERLHIGAKGLAPAGAKIITGSFLFSLPDLIVAVS